MAVHGSSHDLSFQVLSPAPISLCSSQEVQKRYTEPWLGRVVIARRSEMRKLSLRILGDKRLCAFMPEKISEYIARVKAVLFEYLIDEPSLFVNLDEVGVSLDRMSRRILRRAVTHWSQKS